MRVLISVLFIFHFLLPAQAQQNHKNHSGLNAYVQYVNETVHGILIIQRLLQDFNQDINKYVDLDGYPYQNFGNEYLPKNILSSKDYYNPTPEDLFAVLYKVNSHSDLTKINELCKKLKNIGRAMNAIRFEVDDFISSHDLHDPTQLEGVYTRLEKGVKFYDDFFTTQLDIEQELESLGKVKRSKKNTLAFDLSKSAKEILRALRHKKTEGFEQLILNYETKLKAFEIHFKPKNSSDKHFVTASKKARAFLKKAQNFYYDASVPKEYALYGKFYYYHNIDVISSVNKYSNGFISELNLVLSSFDGLEPLLFEEPHYYRVIYPQKLAKEEHLISSDDKIEILPEKLKDRTIVTSNHTIIVDSLRIELELYDHLIEDGDVVSINYNGDWIFENLSLEAKSKKLKIKLNEQGKNYLLVHAESIGKRPPNTVAVAYKYNGKKKRVVLRSDLNTSQMIVIDYQPN